MSDAFEAIADRATARLTDDVELRLEVRRELLTHLHAAADHAAAAHATSRPATEPNAAGDADHPTLPDEQGTPATDPTAAAVAALGEPDALADALWHTHRRRILRRRWARRAAVAFAWPAGVAVLAVLLVTLARSAAPVAVFVQGHQRAAGLLWWPIVEATGARPMDRLAALPANERVLLPESYELYSSDNEAERRSAKAAVDTYPNDRAVYAAYAGREVGISGLMHSLPDIERPSLELNVLAALLAVLDRGAVLDPDNALYPLWTAQALARASSVQRRDQPGTYFPWRERQWRGKTVSHASFTVRVHDPLLFARAVETFHRAVAMPRLDDYSTAFTARRLALLPDEHDLGAQVMRAVTQWNTMKPAAHLTDLHMTMAAHALDLAVAGRAAEALRLAADVRGAEAMSVRAVDSVGPAVFTLGFLNITGHHAAAVLNATGHPGEAGRLRTWTDAQNDAFFVAFKHRMNADGGRRDGGLLQDRVAWMTPRLQPAAGALARAEYTLADRAALAVVVAGLLGLAAMASATAGVGAVGTGGRSALLLLPRPRETAGLLLVSLALPIAAYVLYVLATQAGSREAGLGDRQFALATEYVVLGAAVVTITALVARRHVARQLNAILPRRANAERADAARTGAAGGIRVVGTTLRSMAVRLVIVAVVAGGVGALALRWAETRAVREAERADGLVVSPLIESDARVAALQTFTLAGLREQQQTFAALAAER